jgi:predicted ArsR family transcriptional regulator
MPDHRAHQVLASVSRVAILEILQNAQRPLGVQEVADRIGLHPNTVRMHLDLLVSHGHVVRLRDDAARPGRPRQLYQVAAPPAEPTPPPGDPRQRNYRLLAEVLARYLRTTEDAQAEAIRAGALFGQALIEQTPNGAGESVATLPRVMRMLHDVGFQPELSEDGSEIRLHHCPFHELAEQQQDVVCGIHLGLLRGALEQLGAPVAATRLVPFVTPRLCVVELDPRPT